MSADRDEPMSEPAYFADPAIDRLMGFVYALSAEVWVLRDKVGRLEKVLEKSGVLVPGALETHVPDAAERAASTEDRRAFVAALMQNLEGLQISKGG